MNHNVHLDSSSLAIAAVASIFLFIQAVQMAMQVPLGSPPDEHAHISYIHDISSSERLIPDYENGKILKSHDGKLIESQTLNYLTHPPLYYSALGAAVKIFSLEVKKDYKTLRILSALFVALGFFYFMLATMYLGVNAYLIALFTLACSAIPMFGYLAGSINNDTLVYLGVGSFFFGVARSRLESANIDFVSAFHIACGTIITILTKATGAAFLLLFITMFGLLSWKAILKLMQDRIFLALGFPVLAICGTYFIYALCTYGSIFPAPASLYAINPPTEPLGVAAFVMEFATAMFHRLPIIMSHSNINVFSEAGEKVFYLMLLIPLAGWLFVRPQAITRGATKFNVTLSDAFILALAGTLLIHLYVVYSGYLRTGLFAGVQPRYYYYALPFVWVPFFVCAPPFIARLIVLVGLSISITMVFWLSAPFVLAKQSEMREAKFDSIINEPTSAGVDKVVALRFSSQNSLIGHVEKLFISEDKLIVGGWVFSSDTSTRVRRVWLFENSRFLGSVELSARQDVVDATSNQNALNSGYLLQVNGVSSELRECEVEIAAELSDGSLILVKDFSCVD